MEGTAGAKYRGIDESGSPWSHSMELLWLEGKEHVLKESRDRGRGRAGKGHGRGHGVWLPTPGTSIT